MAAKKSLFLAICFMLLLAACGGNEIPLPDFDPSDADWCYTFNFTSSNYGITVGEGEWINGVGFRTISGDLNLLYTHPQAVAPALITSNLQINYSGTASFSTSFNVFGISQSYADSIPDFIDTYEIRLAPSAANTYGNVASIVVSSQAEVTIANFHVYGMGANPFPSNECEDPPTPTRTPQSLATATASITPTPSPTLTPSVTNTPATTPTGISRSFTFPAQVYHCHIDPNTGVAFFIEPIKGFPTGSTIGSDAKELTYTVSLSANVQMTGITLDTHSGANSSLTGRSWTFNSWLDGSAAYTKARGFPNVWTGAQDEPGSAGTLSVLNGGVDIHYLDFFRMNMIADNDSDGFVSTTAITVTYLYNNAWVDVDAEDCENPPTATPTSSLTPTVTATSTATPTFEEACNFVNYSFNSGLSGWGGSGAVAGSGAAIVTDGDTLSQTRSLSASDYFLVLRASILDGGSSDSDGSVDFGYNITLPDTSTLNSSFGAISESTFRQNDNIINFVLPLNSAPGSHSFVFTADMSSVNSVQILSICVSEVDTSEEDSDENPEDGGGWQTCSDKISSPDSITQVGGWISFLWNSQSQAISCIIMPPINNILNTAIAFVGWTYQTAAGFFDWTFGMLLPYFGGHLANLFSILSQLANLWAALQLIGQNFFIAYNIAVTGTNIVTGYVDVGRAYINVANIQVQNIVAAYNNAPPTAPDGLPDCINAPLEHDVCAIYYALENTVLAGVGAFIIPIIVIFVDIIILFYLLNIIRKFIYSVQELFSD